MESDFTAIFRACLNVRISNFSPSCESLNYITNLRLIVYIYMAWEKEMSERMHLPMNTCDSPRGNKSVLIGK